MSIEDIKKELYKQDVLAEIVKVNNDVIYYTCKIMSPPGEEQKVITFMVPGSDTMNTNFYKKMPAKLLIKYL